MRQLTAAIDKAAADRNLPALQAALADRVVITVKSQVTGQPRHIELTKAQYLKAVEQAWTGATAYRYARRNEKVFIQGQRAVVSADVEETLTTNGESMSTRSQELTVVEIVDGRLQATAIDSTSRE